MRAAAWLSLRKLRLLRAALANFRNADSLPSEGPGPPMAALLLHALSGSSSLPRAGGSMVRGTESLMAPKVHGTSPKAVPTVLRWNVDPKLASRICSYNRHSAEPRGYAFGAEAVALNAGQRATYTATLRQDEQPTTYYDSVTGNPLFVAPIGRSLDDFLAESREHGWPSFRDEEVVWEHCRVLPDGEAISTAGTHLGHNIPDERGNRWCINLCSVAHMPPVTMTEDSIRAALRRRS